MYAHRRMYIYTDTHIHVDTRHSHLLGHAVLFNQRLLREVELQGIIGAQRHVEAALEVDIEGVPVHHMIDC
jgi:hypothetical protein